MASKKRQLQIQQTFYVSRVSLKEVFTSIWKLLVYDKLTNFNEPKRAANVCESRNGKTLTRSPQREQAQHFYFTYSIVFGTYFPNSRQNNNCEFSNSHYQRPNCLITLSANLNRQNIWETVKM